ncbi:MAG: hypothetical protein M5U34_33415 [Chloroflexi bacterium]|nr:hypothetical protein [Chloroflexota bacterium]
MAQHGEVILALGSRRDESATRNQVIEMHRFTGFEVGATRPIARRVGLYAH